MDTLFGAGPEELLASFPLLFEAIGPKLTWVGVLGEFGVWKDFGLERLVLLWG